MVTKHEMREHYARPRNDGSGISDVSPFVEQYLQNAREDEKGMYTLAGELFGVREYYTLDEVKQDIRAAIAQLIGDLQKTAEI